MHTSHAQNVDYYKTLSDADTKAMWKHDEKARNSPVFGYGKFFVATVFRRMQGGDPDYTLNNDDIREIISLAKKNNISFHTFDPREEVLVAAIRSFLKQFLKCRERVDSENNV